MAKFRNKPVVIEAVKTKDAISAFKGNWNDMPKWVANAYEDGVLLVLPKSIEVKTLEGRMIARLDDWIIQGVKGELYPCRPDIFEMTYERVETDPAEVPATLDPR